MAPQREWFEKDYYSVLGVDAEASEKDVTRAYRKLAKQFHPDANPGDSAAEERFKDVSAAYDVLGDADKRKEYDEVRRMVASGAGPGGFGGFGGGPGGFQGNVRFEDVGDVGGLGDILGGLFGRGARRRTRQASGPQKGRDLETELHLDFLDAVNGITTTVSFTAEAACSECGGTGAQRGTIPDLCPTCAGTGTIADNQGPFSFSEVCPTCGGRGQVITDPDPLCKGSGIEVRRRDVKVRIPSGVRDGQRIRVAGRGAPGTNGGPPGDLYVVVHVGKHSVFERDPKNPKNLIVAVPITFVEAALGATVKVPTLGDPVSVKVPAGTESGKTVRVRGKGITPAKGNPGDLLVRFEVAVPKKLKAEEKKAVEALGEKLTANPREHLGV
jgi:molecular chaperone DnaJ